MSLIEVLQLISIPVSVITLAGSVWKFSGIINDLRIEITVLKSKIESLAESDDNEQDRVTLVLNQINEKVSHLRDRTITEYSRLSNRTQDIENFLAKTTEFVIRGPR